MKFSIARTVSGMWLLAACAAASAQPIVCTAVVGALPDVRAEGINERGGDIVFGCTGGIPTAAGAPVPPVNFQIFLNTNITSRLLKDQWSEALLLVDDPAQINQSVAAGGTIPPLMGVGGQGINFTNPLSPPNGGQQVRNVYQGRQLGANSLIWQGIPVDPPGTLATRVIRMTNIRFNASALGVSSTAIPTQVLAHLSATGSTTIPITNPQVAVANIRQGVETSSQQGFSNKDCVSLNENPSNIRSDSRLAILRYRENFASLFKRRNPGTTQSTPDALSPQATPGQISQTETGFYNPNFPNDPVGGNLGMAGLPDHGTRLMARFHNVQAGMQIWVPASGGVEAAFRLVSPPPTSPVGPLGLVLLPANGTAVWEVIGDRPNEIDSVNIPIYPSYTATGIFGDIGVGTATIKLGLEGSTSLQTIPNFRFPAYNGAPTALFTIEPCPDGPPAFNLATPQAPLNFTALLNSMRSSPTYVNVHVLSASRPVSEVSLATNLVIQSSGAMNPATIGWLTANLNQTSTPATVTVTANPAGLAPGTYNGNVRISSTAAVNGPLNFPVRLVIPQPGPALPFPGGFNAASYVPAEVAPGEALVFFGQRYGPASLVTLALNPDGSVATTLGETRVLFDNVAAPMIYAVAGQVAAFAPFGLAGKTSTQVEIEYRGVKSPPVTMAVSSAVPGLITADSSGRGQAAALNQDGSYNNATTPAAPNDIVVFFGTGAGQTNPGGRDGRISGSGAPVGQFTQAVTATIGGQPAEVVYAGPAPGLVEGVLQVNLRISSNAQTGNLETIIRVGGRPSQSGVTVAVRRPPSAESLRRYRTPRSLRRH